MLLPLSNLIWLQKQNLNNLGFPDLYCVFPYRQGHSRNSLGSVYVFREQKFRHMTANESRTAKYQVATLANIYFTIFAHPPAAPYSDAFAHLFCSLALFYISRFVQLPMTLNLNTNVVDSKSLVFWYQRYGLGALLRSKEWQQACFPSKPTENVT